MLPASGRNWSSSGTRTDPDGGTDTSCSRQRPLTRDARLGRLDRCVECGTLRAVSQRLGPADERAGRVLVDKAWISGVIFALVTPCPWSESCRGSFMTNRCRFDQPVIWFWINDGGFSPQSRSQIAAEPRSFPDGPASRGVRDGQDKDHRLPGIRRCTGRATNQGLPRQTTESF